MPSLQESRGQVKEKLERQVDHDAILASLQDEIDQHNAIKDGARDTLQQSRHSHHQHSTSERATKFRFKSHTRAPGERSKHRHSRHIDNGEQHRKHKRRKHSSSYPTPPQDHQEEEEEAATTHPFPREPANPLEQPEQDAFRASLFDALADDEGAAAYWENVYNQPIHIYPRPSVADTATSTGELEEMNEDAYVEYVKRKMWERRHPEVVQERKRKEKVRKFEEEAKTRRREEFVRRKEQAAWERSQSRRFREEEGEDAKYEYDFAGERDWNHTTTTHSSISLDQQQQREYTAAWSTYLQAWENLQRDLLTQRSAKTSLTPNRIPWPVLPSQPVTKPHIEAFMQHTPTSTTTSTTDDAGRTKTKLQILKAERVRWHPDKMLQRFGPVGMEEGTMRLVTGVFQVVDGVLEAERRRCGKG